VLQARRLRDLLDHAWNHSPYYRRLWRSHGAHPRQVSGPADLPRLPIPSRAAFRKRIQDFLPPGFDPRRQPSVRTSGSSGQPLVLPCTQLELQFERFAVACTLQQLGLRPWQRLVRINAPIHMPAKHHTASWAPFPRSYLDSTRPTAEKLRFLDRVRPQAVWGWASALEAIAREFERREQRQRIPLGFSGSVMLTPPARRLVEERLVVRLLDIYASWETSIIAAQRDPRGGLRIRSDLLLVELLDDDGQPVPEGAVHCTVLWRRSVPLIRYPLGDRARWLRAPEDGGGPPTLAPVKGRTSGCIRVPTGDLIPDTSLLDPCEAIPGIAQFQLVQEGIYTWAVRVEPRPGYRRQLATPHVRDLERRLHGLRLRLDDKTPLHRPSGRKFPIVLHQEDLIPEVEGKSSR